MKQLLIFVGLALLLGGCGGHSGVIAKDNKSYVKFTGNWQGCHIQVDEGTLLPLQTKTFSSDTGEISGGTEVITSTRIFELSPGKHTIKVYRDGQLLVKRMLFFGNLQTTEVNVP